jgi:hypothetical protein
MWYANQRLLTGFFLGSVAITFLHWQQRPSLLEENLGRSQNSIREAINYRRLSHFTVDDDWRYNPHRRLEEEVEAENEYDGDIENGNAKQTTDDDCVTEKNYLAELVNHMLYTTPEEWTLNEIILGCCLASVALSSVLVALCCVYGCCAAYCCCCCENKRRRRSKISAWDDETTVSGYGLNYQFTNDSSLV